MPHDAPALLQRLVDGGDVDADAVAWLVRGFATWLRHDGAVSLPAALGLPAPHLLKRQCRDRWLRAAAREIEREAPSASSWEVAERLRMAVQRFERGKWRAWQGRSEPEWGDCNATEAALYYALRAAPAPESLRQYRRIVAATDTETPGDVTAALRESA